MRTQEEILKRIDFVEKEDYIGTQMQTLAVFLDKKHIIPFLEKGVPVSNWKESMPERDYVLGLMKKYMKFALHKAQHHRGISADRSIDHYKAWIWLLGDREYKEVDWEGYINYGVPILKQICEIIEYPIPKENWFIKMSKGEKCPSCSSGSTNGCV